jgi:hypothetical protein
MERPDNPCPFGTTHQHVGPISRERLRAMRAHARDRRTHEWIASHYGIPLATAKRLTEGIRRRGRPPGKQPGVR